MANRQGGQALGDVVEELEAVAGRFLEALEKGDWTGAVSLISPTTLEAQADAWKRRLEAESSDRSLDVLPGEDDGRGPITPEQHNALLLGPAWRFRGDFPEVESLEELLKTSATELAVMYLRTNLSPDRIGVIGMRWRLLGAVLDGADEAHAVFRAREGSYRSLDGEDVEPVSVPRFLRLHRDDGVWKVSGFPARDWGVMGWRSAP